MALFKHQFLLAAAAFLIFAAVIVSAEDFTIGEKGSKDKLMCSKNIYKKANPNENVEAKYKCNVQKYNEVITYIAAYDKEQNYTGGHVEIVSGGLGEKSVILRLWSENSKLLNFNVQVYSKEISNRH